MKRHNESTTIWQKLKKHGGEICHLPVSELFSSDAQRHKTLCFCTSRLHVDVSRMQIIQHTLDLLFRLAESCDMRGWIEKLQRGEKINTSENRPSLHPALRFPKEAQYMAYVCDETVRNVHRCLDKMEVIIDKILSGELLSFSGTPIKSIVHIGAGGSIHGPKLAMSAMAQFASKRAQHLDISFASSLDGVELAYILQRLEPKNTLFIVASKSFITQDTMENAKLAREWLFSGLLGQSSANTIAKSEIVRKHFLGISSSEEQMTDWGIDESYQIQLEQDVGGRFSFCSVVGFVVALSIGMPNFRRMLDGAHHMDRHFFETELMHNLPVILGLIDVWSISICKLNSWVFLPYDFRLQHLPAFLQQLVMESNGKSLTRDLQKVHCPTSPVVWGGVGSDAQHSYIQMLHQGLHASRCEMLVVKNVSSAWHQPPRGTEKWLEDAHTLMLQHFLANLQLLTFGNQWGRIEEASLSDEKICPSANLYTRISGNIPSSIILMDELDPYTLGQLVALYEHRVFVQSVIWEINPFDQWGVESGKKMADWLAMPNGGEEAADLQPELRLHTSTRELMKKLKIRPLGNDPEMTKPAHLGHGGPEK